MVSRMIRSVISAGGAALLFSSPLSAQQDVVTVEFVPAIQSEIFHNIRLAGTIEAVDTIQLSFRQSGRVVEVMVEEGDRVRKGQPLARLDSVQQEQALNVATASLDAALAAQSQARQAGERAEAMLDRGVGTRAARDDAVQLLSESDGAVERAESGVDQARRAVEDTMLIAAVDAVVTSRALAPGQIVGAAQPVLSLAGLGGLEAVFQSGDLPKLDLAMGTRVDLRTIDIDAPDMTGTVTEISPLVDPLSGTVTIRATIADQAGNTRLFGAAVLGELRLSSRSGVTVPWSALTRVGDDPAVWVVTDTGAAQLTPVSISDFGDKQVYLSSGVEAGQIVVGEGSHLVYPGRQVRPAGGGS